MDEKRSSSSSISEEDLSLNKSSSDHSSEEGSPRGKYQGSWGNVKQRKKNRILEIQDKKNSTQDIGFEHYPHELKNYIGKIGIGGNISLVPKDEYDSRLSKIVVHTYSQNK